MRSLTLARKDFFRPGEAFHFSRVVLSKKPIGACHDHDYFELLWLHHGLARHLINGRKTDLKEGDVVFLRPTDCHALQGKGEETHAVNIAFPASVIDGIAGQLDGADDFFWADGKMPMMARRDPRQLADLSHRALALEAGPRDRLAASAFLLSLIAELRRAPNPLPDDGPDWLAKACVAATDPKVFRKGAAGLVRASGRTHAHVSRTMQKIMQKTPSEYINGLRMEYAGRALTGSSDSIATIAADCGITNLSHFHRLFREHFLMTPTQFRRRYQRNIIQPI